MLLALLRIALRQALLCLVATWRGQDSPKICQLHNPSRASENPQPHAGPSLRPVHSGLHQDRFLTNPDSRGQCDIGHYLGGKYRESHAVDRPLRCTHLENSKATQCCNPAAPPEHACHVSKRTPGHLRRLQGREEGHSDIPDTSRYCAALLPVLLDLSPGWVRNSTAPVDSIRGLR